MQVNWPTCLKTVLQFEGGWSDSPQDPGSATMKGVTFETFLAYFPGSTLSDLRNITDAQLEAIYRPGFWNAINGDALPSGLDLEVFDMAVNSGPGRAARMIQGLVKVAQDGDIGPRTLAAIAAIGARGLIISYAGARQAYYRSLPDFETFGKGWLARVNQCEVDALVLARGG